MFEFIKNMFGSEVYLGIDIGTASIKIAEIERGKTKTTLKNYGYLESLEYLDRGNAAFHASTLQIDEAAMAKYLEALLRQSAIARAPVIASLPAFSAFSTLIEIPMISDKEIAQSIGLQAKQYIPIPIAQSRLDWTKVGERTDDSGNKKIQLLLVAIPNDIVARYERICKLARLDLRSVEIEGASLARSLTADSLTPSLIIDIGSRSTSFTIAAKGLPRFTSQTDFAGGSLTQTIATGLHVSAARAEEVKRHRGLSSEGGEYELFTLLQPIVDVIINEGKRVKANYESSYKESVTDVIIAGGGANLPGLERYMTQEFGIRGRKADPFASLTLPEGMAQVREELGPLFAVAIGLCEKRIE